MIIYYLNTLGILTLKTSLTNMAIYDRYAETEAISWWDPPIELQIQTFLEFGT